MKTKDILKDLRKSKGFSTMQEFCSTCNISFSTYQNYETGKRIPTAEILMKLADFYGVTTDYLLGREPLPDPFADLNLRDEDEKEVLAKYMSLPAETRAVLLDALRQLGGVIIDESGKEQPALMKTTDDSKRVTQTAGELENQLKAEQNAEKGEGKLA